MGRKGAIKGEIRNFVLRSKLTWVGSRCGSSSCLSDVDFRQIFRTVSYVIAFYACSISLTFYNQRFIHEFRFPLSITMTHLFTKFVLAACIRWIWFCKNGQERVTLPWGEYFKRAAPPGLTASLDIGLSNWSFEFITISLQDEEFTSMNWTASPTWNTSVGVLINSSMSFLNESVYLDSFEQTNSSGPEVPEDHDNEDEEDHRPSGFSLKRFNAEYQKVHGYISIVVCICGIIANALNAVVLSRKTMQSATNFLLTALAVTDMLTMTSYLPYAAYFYCITSPDVRYPHRRGWIIYLLFNTNFIITSHTVAMWLTVSLAIFRYIVVCRRVAGPGPCTLQRAKVTAAAVVVATVVFCSPNYVMYHPVPLDGSGGAYWFENNDFITSYHEVFNYWVFGVVLKVAPCVLLTVLSTLLIVAMRRADKRRARLKSQGRREESERTGEHNRTTAMLVTVVLSFVLSELPQGVLALLSGIDNSIFHQVYVPLGDVWDIIVLINSAVNFILYCIMSRQFRQTFYAVFCRLECCKPHAPGSSAAEGAPKHRSKRFTLTT